ncbi:alpha/beta hydrolase [Lentisphaera profundi]|uniref:Alpha/beta hydrolase n=1 Tax=Lentisphaera profundi TaxID=1658616 RepID=A0ABY7VMW1_9BACT|nr:alpha/beta hydrolase [Lentisphaera profundi]WDE95390.1 alpha/beta hydrolase [Lentisphaera profundi]
MKRIQWALVAFFALLPLTASEYVTLKNLGYYSKTDQANDAYVKERCVLDLYYPKGHKNFATVVWFHGGGLTSGKKQLPKGLQDKGIALVSVNYRLSPKVKVRQCLEDAAAAVAWTFNNIEKYGGSKRLIILSGHSAGGYLASMIGMDKSWLKKHSVDSDKIAGLIPLSGHTITHFTVRKEMGIPGEQPIIDKMAPLFYVRKEAPPLLLITGDRELEMLGRYEENAYMYRMMKVAGHKYTRILELDGYGHGIVEPSLPLILKQVKVLSDRTLK